MFEAVASTCALWWLCLVMPVRRTHGSVITVDSASNGVEVWILASAQGLLAGRVAGDYDERLFALLHAQPFWLRAQPSPGIL